MKQGMLIIISGPSGVGKGAVRKKIMNENLLDSVFSVSYTTRIRRLRERNGKEYNFISRYEFGRMIENGEFIEYTEYCNNLYGTSKHFVENELMKGNNVLLEIEAEGAKKVMEQYPGMYTLAIYICPPSIEELERRIRKRSSETDDEIKARLEKAKEEMKCKDLYDVVLVNYTLDKTCKRFIQVVENRQKYIESVENGIPVSDNYVIKRK